MKHDIFLGRDSWEPFPIRQEKDVSEEETIVSFVGRKGGGWSSDRSMGEEWIGKAVGMVDVEGDGKVTIESVGKRRWLPNAVSWVKVELKNEDGTEARQGTYRVEFGEKKWFPQEALVEAGVSEIPLRRVGDGAYQLKPNTTVGKGGEPLELVDLDDADIHM